MKYFFPDSQDQIDPGFDFINERFSPNRIRQLTDRYAHEILWPIPYQGILVSKAAIDGDGKNRRYSFEHRRRFHREGVRKFYRLDEQSGERLEAMGDCGSFAYVREDTPNVTVQELIDYYEGGGFDYGIAPDHIVPTYRPEWDENPQAVASQWVKRWKLTLKLAEQFIDAHHQQKCSFQPIGVAQGWGKESFGIAVQTLQEMGYRKIAIGGMAYRNSDIMLNLLKYLKGKLDQTTNLHLLGISRPELIAGVKDMQVTSFDSASPLIRAFKEDWNNYDFVGEKPYTAIRIPNLNQSLKFQRRMREMKLPWKETKKLELEALTELRKWENYETTIENVMNPLKILSEILNQSKKYEKEYERTLKLRPWERCDCLICKMNGIETIIFRGLEWNKRRGFHNLIIQQKLIENLSKK